MYSAGSFNKKKELDTCDESVMEPSNVLDLSLSKEKGEQISIKEQCDENLLVNLMTNEESQTLSKTLEQTHVKDAGETSTRYVMKSSVNKPGNERKQPLIQCKKCEVVFKTLMLRKGVQCVLVTKMLLDTLPTSKYRKAWTNYYLEDGVEDDPVSEILKNRIWDNDGYSSDDMILYSWIPSASVPMSFQDKKLNRATVKKTRSHSKKITTFDINVIGLCHLKPHYWLKCKVPPCESGFTTIVGWNFHHRYAHKLILLKCDKKYSIPSTHHAHKSAHAERKHKCITCGKSFPFKSRLRQHLQKHTKQA